MDGYVGRLIVRCIAGGGIIKDMKKLLILGAGQYGMVAKEIAEAAGDYSQIDFLDDENPIAVGKLNEYERFVNTYNVAIAAIGNVLMRIDLLEKLKECGYEIATLIHPNAYVAPSAVIGAGCFIEPMTVIHTDVQIGIGCIISAGTIVNHNSTIGSGCHLNCGTIVASNSVIQSQTKTQYGTIVI